MIARGTAAREIQRTMNDNRCPKCNSLMNEGFILDYRHHNSPGSQQWVEGKVERYWFRALKLRGRRRLPVVTARCSRCGYLESFANEQGG